MGQVSSISAPCRRSTILPSITTINQQPQSQRTRVCARSVQDTQYHRPSYILCKVYRTYLPILLQIAVTIAHGMRVLAEHARSGLSRSARAIRTQAFRGRNGCIPVRKNTHQRRHHNLTLVDGSYDSELCRCPCFAQVPYEIIPQHEYDESYFV